MKPQHLALFLLGALNLATFAGYALDKAAARRGGRRVPEATLHLLALCGGWPGALLARRLLRHKTAKFGFTLGLWLTVAANLTVVSLLWLQSAAR